MIECIVEILESDPLNKIKVNMNRNQTVSDLKSFIGKIQKVHLNEMRLMNENNQVYRDDILLDNIRNHNIAWFYLKIVDITQVNIQQNHENLSKMIEESKVSDLNMNRRNEVRTIPQIQNQAHPIDNLKTTDKSKLISEFKNKLDFIRNKDLQLLKPQNVSIKTDRIKIIKEEVFSLESLSLNKSPNRIENISNIEIISKTIENKNYTSSSHKEKNKENDKMLKKKRKIDPNLEKTYKFNEEDNSSTLMNFEENMLKNRFENSGWDSSQSIVNDNIYYYQVDNTISANPFKSSFDIEEYFSIENQFNIQENINIMNIKESEEKTINYLNKDNDGINKENENIIVSDLNNIIHLESSPSLLRTDNNIKKKTLDVIFDLDETLVSSNNNIEERYNPFKIDLCINGKKSSSKVVVREGTIDLLQHLNKFCNLFVITNGIEVYANEIIKLLNFLANINIPSNNVIAAKNELISTHKRDLKDIKSFNGRITDNYIIIDDNIKAWKPEYYNNIIISKKFVIESKNDHYQNFFLKDKLAQINIKSHKNLYKYILESNSSKHQQLEYIKQTLDKINFIIHNNSVKSETAFNNIRSNVLNGISINLDLTFNFDEIKLIQDIVKFLGGKLHPREASHIVSDKKIKKDSRNSSKFYVNVKWIFDCYFYNIKLEENHEDYFIKFD